MRNNMPEPSCSTTLCGRDVSRCEVKVDGEGASTPPIRKDGELQGLKPGSSLRMPASSQITVSPGQVLVYSYGYIGQLQMLFCWLMFFWVRGSAPLSFLAVKLGLHEAWKIAEATPGMWDLYMSGKSPNDYALEAWEKHRCFQIEHARDLS